MVGVGYTVFKGNELDEFKVHILGILQNVIGPKRNLILARLEGGPLSETGIISGMSGSPVYIENQLIGAVSYSLGTFSKEPIAGITPIGEMLETTESQMTPQKQNNATVMFPLKPFNINESIQKAFSSAKPFAKHFSDIRLLTLIDSAVSPTIGTMLRPITTPLFLGGFSSASLQPFNDTLVNAGLSATPTETALLNQESNSTLRPGDAIGVNLLEGDLAIGAAGTLTHINGDKVYAFGHALYNLGPINFPMTRVHVHTVLPSLDSSIKIMSSGKTIGTASQDRDTTIAGRLGPGPDLIPITFKLESETGVKKNFQMRTVDNQTFTPLMIYLAIGETLSSFKREIGVNTFRLQGTVRLKEENPLIFENLFTGDQAPISAANYIMTPINALFQNDFEQAQLLAVDLNITTSESKLTATLDRVWIEESNLKPGETATLKISMKTYRGENIEQILPIKIPSNAQGQISIIVSDGSYLNQWETQKLYFQKRQVNSLSQMIRAINSTYKNDRFYVRLLSQHDGAVFLGEQLSSLPPSVSRILKSDQSRSTFYELGESILDEWEILAGHVVSGNHEITLNIN
tara:strand:- start:524 stop:2251 length:1728 start_codon:yes stop_codon:yes gene_type:complete